MRPLKLSLEAFGPYAGNELIDFEALRAAGLFVVSGPTGSGKSSIFDALSYALYGELPGARKGAKSIRSDHAPAGRSCEVNLEFVAANQTWRVSRRPSFERPKKRGTGTMTADAEVTLARWHDGSWQGVESKLREVDEKCKELVGLDFAQFQRVVLLPQGGFSQVLNAKSSDRQDLLRTLFSTDLFDNASSKLKELSRTETDALRTKQDVVSERISLTRSALTSALSEASLELEVSKDLPLAGIEEMLTQKLKPQIKVMVGELDELKEVETAERKHLAEAERTTKSLNRLAELKEKAEKLDSQSSDIEKSTRRLEASKAALPVLNLLLTSEKAANELADSVLGEQTARKQLEGLADGLCLPADLSGGYLLDLGSKFELERERLAALLESQKKLSLKQASQDVSERELFVEVAALKAAKAKLDSLGRDKERLTQNVAESEKISLSLPLLEKNHQAAEDLADGVRRLTALNAEVANAETQARNAAEAKAVRVQELEVLLKASEASETGAAEKLLVAEEHYESTLLEFIKSTAPRLAAELLSDEPCPVCGSKNHPNPASGDEVRDLADLQLSQSSLGVASLAVKNATTKRHGALDAVQLARRVDPAQEGFDKALLVLRTQQASLVEELGPTDESQIELDLATALTNLECANSAAATLVGDKGELEKLTEAIRDTSLELAKQETRISERQILVEESMAKLSSESNALSRELAGLDPQAQIEGTDAQRDSVKLLVDAYQQRSTSEALAASSKTELAKSLSASPFELNKEVHAASLDETETKLLEQTVSSWGRESAETSTLLKQLDAENLPEQWPDLERLIALCVEATKKRDAKAESLTAAKTHLEAVETNIASLGPMGEEIAESQRLAEELKQVADVCSGTNPRRVSLEAWVLGAYLREVVVQANLHLLPMSSERYSLAVGEEASDKRTSSGLDLVVQDAHTGRSRSASSLSGGETFQASLALALGLADVVTAGRSGLELDCIFIDEGFGSLDPDSLELAIDVLDGLRSRGSLVGVITHVVALKDALELGIEVLPLASGEGSTLQQFA